MASCRRCGVSLPGRRQKCDACKAAAASGAVEEPTYVEPDPPEEAPDPTPAGLRSRGRALWSSLGVEVGTLHGELALEACRMADRLDELDRIVAGKGVLQLMKFRLDPDWWDGDGNQHVHVKVGFQSVLAEARQQQATFKALLVELAELAEGTPAAPTGQPAEPPPMSGLDQLAARRAEREQAAR
ncbi:MAG TPA: hypothetical protein VNS46_06745 [Nocardioides sp.]|nr:hypothetical protein [Nocardioides sp.]